MVWRPQFGRPLVVPALGTGAGCLSLEEGVRPIIEEIDEHESEPLERIDLIAYDDEASEQMQEVAGEHDG